MNATGANPGSDLPTVNRVADAGERLRRGGLPSARSETGGTDSIKNCEAVLTWSTILQRKLLGECWSGNGSEVEAQGPKRGAPGCCPRPCLRV